MIVEIRRKVRIPSGGELKPERVVDVPEWIARLWMDHRVAVPVNTEVRQIDAGQIQRIEWADIHQQVGAPPYDLNVYHHTRRNLQTIAPGESILIIRKYGGLGDVLAASMDLDLLLRLFPENPLTFATPIKYHPLFKGNKRLALLDYDLCYLRYERLFGGMIKSQIADRYDCVEDISTPCGLWEDIFRARDFDYRGLLWRCRVDIWANSMGLYEYEAPGTAIVVPKACRDAARLKLEKKAHSSTRPICLIAPVSSAGRKDFPWPVDLRHAVEEMGYRAVFIGDKPIMRQLNAIAAEDSLDFVSCVQAADLTISVDSAAMHAAGVLRRPCIGLFTIVSGKAYTKYYPTVIPLQVCPTPCLARDCHRCQRLTGSGSCYPKNSVDLIIAAMKGEVREVPIIEKITLTGAPIRLNIGCGDKLREGIEWINIDIRKLPPPQFATLMRHDARFIRRHLAQDESVEEILLSDVLEHLYKPDAERLLGDYYALLKKGGRMTIKTPAVEALIAFCKGHPIEEVAFRWYGGNDYPENVHKFCWPRESLRAFLRGLGFQIIREEVDNVTNVIFEVVK